MKAFRNGGNHFIACCVCKAVKGVDGNFVSLLDLDEEDAISFIVDFRKMQNVSHGYCPPCLEVARENAKLELLRLKGAAEERKNHESKKKA